jgi:oligopeptide transport system substrate-binding protein
MILLLAACGSDPETVIAPGPEVSGPATVAIPVVQTQVVVETQPVEVTVVVTATPSPTPSYVSRINARPGTLVYPLAAAPASLDPQLAVDETAGLVVEQLYEGLFHLRGDGTTSPGAATGYDVAPDGLTYTVTLRSDLKWSDGEPLTAQHYVDGLCRLLEPETGNSYYYLLTEILAITGARDFAGGDVADCAAVGFRAADESTLVINLERPASFLPKLLAFRAFLPYRADANQPGRVTNGPYTLEAWDPGERLTLAKNSAYWDADTVEIERIEFPIIPDSAEQLRRYEAGDLHIAQFPAGETPRIQADPTFAEELQVLVQPGTSYLGLNTQITPTQDVNVRRAIASAIDRKTLIDSVLEQPWHRPAQVVVPPSVEGYQGDDPSVGYGYDPQAAREYLAQAGFDEDNPPPPVELWYNREGNNEPLFRAIAEMLERVGIPVRLSSTSWNVHRDSLDACHASPRRVVRAPAECSYNAYRMGWVMDYADPSSILDVVFNPTSSFQYTGWESPTYEELMDQARSEPDEAGRTEQYREAERLLLNEAAVVVPLQFYDRTLLIKDGLEFEYPTIGAPQLQYWKLPE